VKKIIVVCSAHKERGFCNSKELLGILEQLKPDIIFEELSSRLFEKCYVYNEASFLETDTIKQLLRKVETKHIPVDIDIGSEQEIIRSFKQCNIVFDKLIDTCYEYYRLKEKNEIMTRKYGFRYLNSELHDSIDQKTVNVELSTLKNSSPDLLYAYNNWIILNDKREKSIINNVSEYCKTNDVYNGVLLIGAGHRRAVKNIFMKENTSEDQTIDWIMSEYTVADENIE
jgi:hypothetical protein